MSNFNMVEKNLKKWLKRKVKVTLGMMVAFMITGTVGFAVEKTEPIEATDGQEVTFTEDIFSDIKGNSNIVYSIGAFNEGIVNISSENIKLNVAQQSGKNFAYGVTAQNGGTINLGNNKTKNIDINVSGDNFIIGVYTDKENNDDEKKGGTINITSETLNIAVHATENGRADGIYCITRTTNALEENKSKVTINAKDTIINVSSEEGQANGITAWSQGQVKINGGNVSIKADNIINTRGNSLVEINKDNNTNNTVKLDGDINFKYDGVSSGTTIDSDIIINLSNSDSYFNGNIIITSNVDPIPGDKGNVGGMQLGLSNGAQWNTDANSFVNTLNFNNGIININGGNSQTVSLYDVKGTGGTINIKTSITEDGFNAGKLVIGKEADSGEEAIAFLAEEISTPKLDINFTEITADYITTEEFKNLVGSSITVNGNTQGTLSTTVKVEEGLTEGAITGNLGTDGVTNVTQNTTTTTMDGLQALATNTYIAWKQEMNSLNKRMGELRNSTGNEGVWARVYAGESEYNKGYENKYQTYQVGYDKKYSTDNGTGFVGYLVSYTQGDTDYSHNSYGTGDNTSVGGGIYGTWLGNSGDYVDVIFKVSRLENKYDVTSLNGINSKGDYNTFGMSLSAEYGRRFNVTKGFFIEPSVEMSLGRVGAEDYRTSSGLNVEQDTIYTAEGRVGTALGYNFDKGNVYVRVAGVKEFAGEIDTTINGKPMTEDLGDSWIEYGIGANYRVLENLNLYVDFEKTGSAEVQTNWQGNLGFRYEF